MADAETVDEYQSALNMARAIGAKDNVPHLKRRMKYDPEEGLNLAFYNKAVQNDRKTKLGFHFVFDDAGKKLLEEDGTPRVMDCDCEEENEVRGKKSTLARVIKEMTLKGVHCTPGRPIFEDQIWIRIIVPGEQRNEVDTQAIIVGDPDIPDTHVALPEAAHNQKYPQAWASYKQRQNKRLDGAAVIGTPLKVLAGENVRVLKPSQVMGLENIGVQTVEQLLAMSDGNAQHIMGWSTIKHDVQAWSDSVAKQGPSILIEEVEKRAQAKIDAQRTQIETLQEQVRQMNARMTLGAVHGIDPGPEPKVRKSRVRQATP